MSRKPEVTVGMPVYNDPSGLLRSVPTVFNQTWDGEVRLLIVDDGSSDETPEVIASLRDIYPGIEVIRNDDNRGRPFARNQVLDNADSPYLAWLDSGDLWHPRKLEVQWETLARAEQESEEPVLCTTSFRWVFADSGQEKVKNPEVSGDQLYNALTSSLPPYLWTFLGRTSAYRSAGGFDARLPRRQDYEFFVRFIEQGGRVVATPPDLPLATYMKTDVGRSAAEVASSNLVIRELHRPLYARYGRRFAGTMQRRQLGLEARFYENNGKRGTAAAYRALGWLRAPSLPSPRGIRRRLGRLARRVIARGARLMVRVLRPVLPLLRRTGLTSLIRRVANPQGIMPAYYRELERWSPAASETAKRLEAEIASGSDGVAIWLQLEQAYRQAGLLESAHSALERGRARHPDNVELTMRKIELHALRRELVQCVDMWTSLSSEQLEQATAHTYYRAGWVYRQLDDPEESVRVLEAGLSRWPGDQWLLAQLHKSRARSTDWKSVIEFRGDSDEKAVGMVTDLGFLSGGESPVRGRLPADSDQDPTVKLMVNGLAVTSTSAAHTLEGNLGFSFKCTGLMEYLGDGDTVSFERRGEALGIDGGNNRCVFRPGYESRFAELRDRLANGYVFENLGRFVEGNTPRRKWATLDLYDEIRELVTREAGYQVYPMYGNLLGAIRENDFITHDVGGFDVAYVSKHRRADAVRDEFVSICRMLVDGGYHLKLKPWSAYVRPQRASDVFVDLNYGWFNTGGELNLSFGWRKTPVIDPGLLTFPREAPLGRHWVPVPGNAEAVLNQIYGPTWITPNQGYSPVEELKRDHAFLLTVSDMEAIRDHNPDLVEIAPEDSEIG